MPIIIKRSLFFFSLVLIGLLFLCGCSSPGKQQPTSIKIVDYDGLVANLASAGAKVEVGEQVQEPFFTTPGRNLKVNSAQVIVMQYPNEIARKADSAKISKDGFSVGSSMIEWIDRPNFWAQGKLIVLYLGTDPDLMALFTRLLGAPITNKPQILSITTP